MSVNVCMKVCVREHVLECVSLHEFVNVCVSMY